MYSQISTNGNLVMLDNEQLEKLSGGVTAYESSVFTTWGITFGAGVIVGIFCWLFC